MREKNVFQCDEHCESCAYELKKPTGFTIIDECTTDKCPNNNYKIGNIDRIGGRHVEGYGWNPLGEFCNQCTHDTCDDCIKWSNRDKKLRNNIPPQLKQEKNKEKTTNNKDIGKIRENSIPKVINNGETKEVVVPVHTTDMWDDLNEFDSTFTQTVSETTKYEFNKNSFESDEDLKESRATIKDNAIETSYRTEKQQEFTDAFIDNGKEDTIDFGETIEFADTEEGYTVDQDYIKDEIPNPNNDFIEDEYEEVVDEYEDEDEDEGFVNTTTKNAGNDDDDEDDEDDEEDFDEDDDAEFEMFEATKKLKSSMLFATGVPIARYKVRENIIILNVVGTVTVTVKGRDDSDGFSYYDPNRFPRYIKERIQDGSIFTDANMKVVNNSYFNFAYYKVENGEEIEKDNKRCDKNLSSISEEKLRKFMKEAMDFFVK